MPHFIVEYSSNLKPDIDFNQFFEAVHECLGRNGVFPKGGIRSRAICLEDYRVADAKHDYAFIHILLKIGSGRDEATLKKEFDALFDVIQNYFAPLQEKRLLAISFELQEISPIFTHKKNNIHAFLKSQSA